jgi:hypothetical protein
MLQSCKHVWIILTYQFDWKVKECRKCYEFVEIQEKDFDEQ